MQYGNSSCTWGDAGSAMQRLCGSIGRCSPPRQELLWLLLMQQPCDRVGPLSLRRQQQQELLLMLPGTGVQGRRSQKQQLQLDATVMQQCSDEGDKGLRRTPARPLMIWLRMIHHGIGRCR
jgi:hypothetical protein